jgi:hypothetical protein
LTHFERMREQWMLANLGSTGRDNWNYNPGIGIPAVLPGRQTQPNEFTIYQGLIGRQYNEFHGADLSVISAWDHKSIIRIIRQISPEASQAITTYLRVFDSGFTVEVRKPSGTVHQQAKDALMAWISKIEMPDGTMFEQPKTIRHMALIQALDALIKGAVGGELVLDSNFNPVKPVYVDPWSVDFAYQAREMSPPFTQERWIPQQHTRSGYISLDIPTFAWVPVDPLGNDPYGEEQINSAIRAILFKIMVMQDLKQAIHANAWHRLDFSVAEEAIMKNLPPGIRNDPLKLRDFIASQLDVVKSTFQALNPDDNLVHTSSISVAGLNADKTGRGFIDPSPVINAVDSQITNALKTFQSILSKKLGGGSEGFTSIEGVLYLKMISGFQSVVEDWWERIFTMALRYMGFTAQVEFGFRNPELRSEIEQAQFRRVELDNIGVSYNEQAIGEKEKAVRIREVMGFDGAVPDDVSPERIMARNPGNQGSDPNQPDRPASSEPAKEERRGQTNRDRRSGQQ